MYAININFSKNNFGLLKYIHMILTYSSNIQQLSKMNKLKLLNKFTFLCLFRGALGCEGILICHVSSTIFDINSGKKIQIMNWWTPFVFWV